MKKSGRGSALNPRHPPATHVPCHRPVHSPQQRRVLCAVHRCILQSTSLYCPFIQYYMSSVSAQYTGIPSLLCSANRFAKVWKWKWKCKAQRAKSLLLKYDWNIKQLCFNHPCSWTDQNFDTEGSCFFDVWIFLNVSKPLWCFMIRNWGLSRRLSESVWIKWNGHLGMFESARGSLIRASGWQGAKEE